MPQKCLNDNEMKKKTEKLKTAVTPVLAMQCTSCGQVIELDVSEIIYRE